MELPEVLETSRKVAGTYGVTYGATYGAAEWQMVASVVNILGGTVV
jgi:hypothetical protein